MGQGAGKEAEDPSMEDILASIRRILNEDEPAPGSAHAAPAAPATPALSSEPAQMTEPPSPLAPPHALEPDDEDVFVLDGSMLVEEPQALPHAVLPEAAVPPATELRAPPLAATTPPDRPFEPQQAPPAPMTSASEPETATGSAEALMAPSTAAAASASMGALVRVIGQQQTPVYRGGPTLEDMVRDELRPMVKSWLDEHLAPMVERLVRAEIARVTEGK